MNDNVLADTLSLHRGFWTGEAGPVVAWSGHAPLSALTMPLAGGKSVNEDMPLTPEQVDPMLLVELEESPSRPRLQPDRPGAVSGDVLVVRPPYGRMCWVEAVMGCPVAVRVDSGSIYSEPYLDGPSDLGRLPSHYENGWLDLLGRLTRALVDNSDGAYHVTLPLMRGTIDLVAALLGYERMCFSLYDEPKQLRKLIERSVEAYMAVADEVYGVIPRLEGGTVSRFNVWAPGSVAITQCDASAVTSPGQYEEFFFPFDAETCARFDYSVVHLHSGYLHTVDTLLRADYPTAIQVSLDTGSTPLTVHDLIPLFKKVLERKPLFITGPCTKRELDELLASLPHKGLCIVAELMDA